MTNRSVNRVIRVIGWMKSVRLLMLATEPGATMLTLDVSTLPSGIYLVRTATARGLHQQKLIVK